MSKKTALTTSALARHCKTFIFPCHLSTDIVQPSVIGYLKFKPDPRAAVQDTV